MMIKFGTHVRAFDKVIDYCIEVAYHMGLVKFSFQTVIALAFTRMPAE